MELSRELRDAVEATAAPSFPVDEDESLLFLPLPFFEKPLKEPFPLLPFLPFFPFNIPAFPLA